MLVSLQSQRGQSRIGGQDCFTCADLGVRSWAGFLGAPINGTAFETNRWTSHRKKKNRWSILSLLHFRFVKEQVERAPRRVHRLRLPGEADPLSQLHPGHPGDRRLPPVPAVPRSKVSASVFSEALREFTEDVQY